MIELVTKGNLDPNAFEFDAVGKLIKPKANSTSFEDVLVFPEPQGLIRVDWWGDAIPTANVGKQEYTGRSRIVIDGVAWEGKSKFKTQGAGSIGYPKKNLSLKFYDSDDNRLKVKIGDSCVFTDFVFKAEYTDGSKANNYICYKLIEQMTKCRGAFPSHEVDYAWLGDTGNVPTGMPSGAVGYVKIWPCVMYHNDVFYGVGNLIIKEDLANFNIDENNPNHTHFEFDGRGTINGDSQPNWNRLDPALTDQVQLSMSLTQDREDAIMRLNALVTGTQQNFNDHALECFDKRNLIDCYLLLELVFGWDNVVMDLDFVSYDNQKFYIFLYDFDLSLSIGLPDGVDYLASPTDPLVLDNTSEPSKTLWVLMRNAWGSEIRARYGELRSRGVFSAANIAAHGKRIAGLFTPELLTMEYAKWPASFYQIHTIAQIMSWITARLTWLDGEMGYVPHDYYVTAVYQGSDPDFPRPDGAGPVYWMTGTKPIDAKEGDYIITEMDI